MRHLTSALALLILGAITAVPATAGADPDIGATPTATAEPAAEPSAEATAEPSAGPDAGPSVAESSAPVPAGGAHQVTYTVTTTSDLTANIYYVTADPPDQGAANAPEFMPLARTVVGPGAPWTMQTTLEDPSQWAFISASGGLRVNPEFRCEIAVDGQVVVTQQGGSGVQCALRPW